MNERNGMRLCLNLGTKCKGLTYNLGTNTVRLKSGVLVRPKFTLGVVTILKKEYKDFIAIKEKSCAPVVVSFILQSTLDFIFLL